jgi:hypothetical protein
MKLAKRLATCVSMHGTVGILAIAGIASCSDRPPADRPRPMNAGGEAGHGGNVAEDSGAVTGGDSAGLGGHNGDIASFGGDGGAPPVGVDDTRDILATHLELDVATHLARATIELEGSLTSSAATFEVGDLDIKSVENERGTLAFAVRGGERGALLDVEVPPSEGSATLVIDYAFRDHSKFDGWLSAQQVSFLWPYHCGNLFPCKSDPAEGLAFTMQVTGYASGMRAVFPSSIPADAPSYMPAFAVGTYTELDLGSTTNGTRISAWHLPGFGGAAAFGTRHLAQVFDFYEQTYGEYSFGDKVGSVSVDWGSNGFRGMEHHPYWHINVQSFNDEVVHAHEAAHGWYGNGVRIACWEDLVLSEGTASYMAARALQPLEVDAWPDYECRLKRVCDPAIGINTIALPDTCDALDIANDPLGSAVPYMKGAFFLRQVAAAIGPERLDTALAGFYRSHVGSAASMQALIDFIETKTDAAGRSAIDALADSWLRQLECPVDFTGLFCASN